MVTTGPVTLTVKLVEELLPAQSVATQVTGVVVPGANKLPEGGVHMTVTLLQAGDVAVGV